jgi:flavin reductase (DIM6/NTAB) family NADH-FMN oxidoreductase RutF
MQAKAHSTNYRGALAQFATGVTVVTTRAADGTPVGLTVNSFNSVSLEPPLVLWSLALKANSLVAFEQCSHYAINVLSDQQLAVAKRFATRGAERFGPKDWQPGPFELPLLEGCVATLVATNRSRYREGDHMILVGEVVQFDAPGGVPLVFHDGRYIAHAVEAPLPPELRTPWR